MHTLTQHAPYTDRDRLRATYCNPNTDIQTIHPLGLGICESSLGSKPCNNSRQHDTNFTEQRSTNHHLLHTNYTNKPLTLRNTGTHITRLQPVQMQTTHATTCWSTNQLHVASKLPHKHYTLDFSTPSPNTLDHTSTCTSQT